MTSPALGRMTTFLSCSSSSPSSPLIASFLHFLRTSPSHFHATHNLASRLVAAGFTRLTESSPQWSLKPLSGYFFTRNQSSLVAFMTPSSFPSNQAQESGKVNPFLIVAAHTDSPVLKVKPISKVTKHGVHQVGVECYGGGLWNTWFDRDLSVAGRVIVCEQDGKSEGKNRYQTRLLSIEKPVLRIPSLAIHLNREVNEKGFIFNKQTHLLPLLSTAKQALNDTKHEISPTEKAGNNGNKAHHSSLLTLLAKELNVKVESIVDLELSLFDTQPAALGGACDEFILARGLDNLCMSFVSIEALLRTYDIRDTLDNGENDAPIRMVALFDNEEVGSESWQGAGSSLMAALSRIHTSAHTLPTAIRRSLLVSADMAHAVHPNYAESHEENHRPELGGGLVIKRNANQRYATSPLTSLALNELARQHNLPVQQFVVRNDSACGSTIGPILSANTGIRTVDVGVPQLSMHSIREMAHVDDVNTAIQLLVALMQQYAEIEQQVSVEGE